MFSFRGEDEKIIVKRGGNFPQMHRVHSQSCVVLCVCVRVCFGLFFPPENFSVKLIFHSVNLTSDAMKKSKQKNNEKKDT